MKDLTMENFKTELSANKKMLVDFYATWCYPCKMMAPIVEEFEKKHPEIPCFRLDTDKATEIAITYGVMSIPTLILFEDGKVKEQTIGVTELSEMEELFLK